MDICINKRKAEGLALQAPYFSIESGRGASV